MEAILKAVKRSPRPFSARTSSGTPSSSSSKSKHHEKFADKWGEEKEPVKEGVTFYLKYVGSTLVEELTEEGASYGDNISSAAVQTIVNMAKLSGKKKLPKMALTVSTRGIKMVNMANKEVKDDITIYRICFCTADKNHEKIFAFVARNTVNETMECYAFLCPKRKIAQAVTLTVAQAFGVAQEEWETKQIKERQNKNVRALSAQSSPQSSSSQSSVETNGGRAPPSEGQLIDLLDLREPATNYSPNQNTNFLATQFNPDPVQMGFEDNFVEEDEFSSLAQSRSGTSASANTAIHINNTQLSNPFYSRQLVTGLRAEDLDEGVEQLMRGGQHHTDQLQRQPSIDDLLSL